jgi:hypothetical protein
MKQAANTSYTSSSANAASQGRGAPWTRGPLAPAVAPPHAGHVAATTTTPAVLLAVCHQMLLEARIVQGARFARKSAMKPISAGTDMMTVMHQTIVLQTWRRPQVLIKIGT